MRRYGAPPRDDQTYVHRAGVYAILRRGDQVLLTHQTSPWPEYQLPGGGVDPGEAPLAALHREVAEETGWQMTAARRWDAHRRFTFMPDYGIWAEKVCVIYVARPTLRRGPPGEDGHSAHWVSLGEAVGMVASPGDQAALARLAANAPAGGGTLGSVSAARGGAGETRQPAFAQAHRVTRG